MQQAYNIPAHVRQTLGGFPSATHESVRDLCEAGSRDANVAVPCSSIDSRANTRHLIIAVLLERALLHAVPDNPKSAI
jgi:hypothetical protein